MANNIMDVFRQVRTRLVSDLKKYDLQLKSAGTGTEDLKVDVDEATGYWKNPRQISSKPPRWIVQFEKSNGEVMATYSRQHSGQLFGSARTLGYINNREGKCSVLVFRVLAAVKTSANKFTFPGWEWLLVLTAELKLPAGNSSEVIDDFDIQGGTFTYQRKAHKVKSVGLITSKVDVESIPLTSTETITYEEATEAIRVFLDGNS